MSTADVTIRYTTYRSLFETSAAHDGVISAHAIAHAGKFFHPGDNLGRLLCRVWRVRPDSAGLALTAYMVSLDKECERLGPLAPAFTAVVKSLPLAINENEFPDIDISALIATVSREVPEYYADAV